MKPKFINYLGIKIQKHIEEHKIICPQNLTWEHLLSRLWENQLDRIHYLSNNHINEKYSSDQEPSEEEYFPDRKLLKIRLYIDSLSLSEYEIYQKKAKLGARSMIIVCRRNESLRRLDSTSRIFFPFISPFIDFRIHIKGDSSFNLGFGPG